MSTARRADATANRERLAEAAVSAIHREGPAVPMATIARDAGVGVGTLYRHFPSRDELFEELTHRSFLLMLHRVTEAASAPVPATDVVRAFLTGVIADRDRMLLPSTGGPAVDSDRIRAVQRELHAAIESVLTRGRADGSVRRTVDVWDVAWLGATLAQPGRPDPGWSQTTGRLLETYLAGLGVDGAVPSRHA